jgi:RecA-family ATPase
MELIEQAARYLQSIPPAISGQGGHSQTLNAARALVWGFNLPEAQAMELLSQWNQGCQPPWSQRELEHKIKEANSKEFGKPRGYLLSKNQRYLSRNAARPGVESKPEVAAKQYDLSTAQEIELPKGKRDGFFQLLEACFKPGEGVRVMGGMDEEGHVRCDPHGGVVLSREEWISKLEQKGSINALYYRLGGPPLGVYLGINPMKIGGGNKDADVTAYRHCLLEFDKISIREQWALIVQSNIPCAAVIYSGNKSIHAWVKVDAPDRKTYDERVSAIYDHFREYQPDVKNKNPSRFSRCPDAKRDDTVQYLLGLNLGAESYTEWSKQLLVEGIGITYSAKEVREYDPTEDGMTVAGDQWLRKGGSCILVGPSGVGKSSLACQIAMCWALGRPCFGVTPVKPLKILFLQAENDLADLHSMNIGIYQGLGILDQPEALEMIDRNLVYNHNVADTGHSFIVALQKLVDYHEPDLVIVDPLLSFIGDDASRQEIVGRFFRNWLNPILHNSNVAFMGVHHTGKPPQQQEGKGGKKPPRRSLAEWSYQMMGSSELTNWARAVVLLNQLPEGDFELIFSKRGKRAQATHPNGSPTQIVRLRHSPLAIFWAQEDPPEEPVTASESEPQAAPNMTAGQMVQTVASSNLYEFTNSIPKEGISNARLREMIVDYAANTLGIDLGEPRSGRVTRTLEALVRNHKLSRKGKLYIKGHDA